MTKVMVQFCCRAADECPLGKAGPSVHTRELSKTWDRQDAAHHSTASCPTQTTTSGCQRVRDTRCHNAPVQVMITHCYTESYKAGASHSPIAQRWENKPKDKSANKACKVMYQIQTNILPPEGTIGQLLPRTSCHNTGRSQLPQQQSKLLQGSMLLQRSSAKVKCRGQLQRSSVCKLCVCSGCSLATPASPGILTSNNDNAH